MMANAANNADPRFDPPLAIVPKGKRSTPVLYADLCDPRTLGERVLDSHASEILLVGDDDPRCLVLDGETGLWRESRRVMELWCVEACEAHHTAILEENIAPGKRATLLRQVEADLRNPKRTAKKVSESGIALAWGLRPEHWPELMRCAESELDAAGHFLGCENGVVDLRSGALLPPLEGRKQLVTQSTGTRYDADNEDPGGFVEQLFAHVSAADCSYILAAIGYALRGCAAQRLYLLVGPTRGGKSTLLGAVKAALGDYATMGSERLLSTPSGGHTEQLRPMLKPARICILNELAKPRDGISPAAVKRLTDGEPISFSGKHERERDAEVTATLVISANEERLPRLGTSADKAMQRRFRRLNYPPIPQDQADKSFQTLVREVEAREALLAELVRAAVDNPTPPSDTPEVAAARQAHFKLEGGLVGELAEMIVPSPGENLHIRTVWRRFCRESGEGDEHAVRLPAWFGRRLSEHNPLLPPRKKVRADGKAASGWPGFTLADE